MAEDPSIAAAQEERRKDLRLQMVLLREVVTRILKRKARFREVTKPEPVLKPIIEFKRRMRVSSIDKFESTTYISSIGFFANDAAMDENKPLGAVIILLEEKGLLFLLRKMDYPIEDNDDPEELKDACGTLCNLICGSFKSGLSQLDYEDVTMSHFSSFQNEAPFGIDYDVNEQLYCEMAFGVEDYPKLLIVNYTMGSIPKKF